MLATMADLYLTLEWRRPFSRCGYCVPILLAIERNSMYSGNACVYCLFVVSRTVCAPWALRPLLHSCVVRKRRFSSVCVCLVNNRWIYVPKCMPALSEGLFACLCVFCILVCPCPVALFVCVLFWFCFYSACSCVRLLYNSVECLRLCVCAV